MLGSSGSPLAGLLGSPAPSHAWSYACYVASSALPELAGAVDYLSTGEERSSGSSGLLDMAWKSMPLGPLQAMS